MIHVFIGTKAQYVKMAPVLKELERRGMTYNLIDSGQHAAISKDYRSYFQIKEPDRFLSTSQEDIKTVSSLLVWAIKFLTKIIFVPQRISRDLFRNEKGICLIHGDTPTTLLSAFAAKRVGIKVAHLESGLRSYDLFHPFPEEIIRIITMRIADYLFAPSQWAYDNLKKMRVKGKLFLICGNTNIDALKLIERFMPQTSPGNGPNENYAVFSIHRVETILNSRRLKRIVQLAEEIARQRKVVFCLHPPTKKQLEKNGLYERLKTNNRIEASDLWPYPKFIQLIRHADFIVTDGGSVQEESYFLNVPCLLMRNKTERLEGLKENVCLSEFKETNIKYFLNNFPSFKQSQFRDTGESPSQNIVDILTKKILGTI